MTWWNQLYDDALASAFLHRGDTTERRAAETTAALIVKATKLPPGSLIFDQCCGTGRLSVPLAKAGFRVIGIDQAKSYVLQAQQDAEQENLTSAQFLVADGFTYITPEPVDAVVNWWTSFGYCPDDAANLRMLHCAYRSLKPGGMILLDTMNAPEVLRHFRATDEQSFMHDDTSITLKRRCHITLEDGMLHKEWRYLSESGHETCHTSHVRLYQPHELRSLFAQAGFTDVFLADAAGGSPLTLDSRRCVVHAQKPS